MSFLLIVLGLSYVFQASLFKFFIGTVGGVLLLVYSLAYVVKSRRNKSVNSSNIMWPEHNAILGGVMFSTILNPSVLLWWSTIGSAMLLEALLVASMMGIVFWFLGHISADLVWYLLVSSLAWNGKNLIGLKFYRRIILLCGFMLLFFGGYFTLKYGFVIL